MAYTLNQDQIPLQVKQARMRNSPSYEIILFPRELDFFSSTAKLPGHNNLQEPLPLVRAASRCYAPCDTVSWLSRKVKQLGDQLRTTQAALKKLMDNPVLKGEGKLLYFYDCFVFLSMGINQERNLKIFMIQKVPQLKVQ